MNKIISMENINKIKEYKYRIFCAEDDNVPNRRVVARNRREIDKILKPYTEAERYIIYCLIDWNCDHCAARLEGIGFTVVSDEWTCGANI